MDIVFARNRWFLVSIVLRWYELCSSDFHNVESFRKIGDSIISQPASAAKFERATDL
jgi:hypothetical protein